MSTRAQKGSDRQAMPVDADEAERLVHDAVALGEDQGEDHGVRNEVYRHRQEEREPEGGLAPLAEKVRVDNGGDDRRQPDHERHLYHQDEPRVQERLQEQPVGEEPAVVLQPTNEMLPPLNCPKLRAAEYRMGYRMNPAKSRKKGATKR
jgi:hypothetical protein